MSNVYERRGKVRYNDRGDIYACDLNEGEMIVQGNYDKKSHSPGGAYVDQQSSEANK